MSPYTLFQEKSEASFFFTGDNSLPEAETGVGKRRDPGIHQEKREAVGRKGFSEGQASFSPILPWSLCNKLNLTKYPSSSATTEAKGREDIGFTMSL